MTHGDPTGSKYWIDLSSCDGLGRLEFSSFKRRSQKIMIFLLILSAISLLLFYNYYYKRRDLPPGPAPLPFVGNLLDLDREERWEDKFIEWTQQYGPVYTYWLGEMPIVSVCGYQEMVKYFVKNADVFSDRVRTNSALDQARGGTFGVVFNSGEPWREYRRFALKVLRDFGLGKNQMEERIQAEVQNLIEKVNGQLDSDEIDFFKYTDIAVGSIINAIVAGYRFTEGREEEFYLLKDLSTAFMRAFGTARASLVLNNPKLMQVPILNSKAKETVRILLELFAFLDRQIEEHLADNDYTQDLEPNSFIDAYLLERQRHIQKNSSEGYYNFPELRNICMDLWMAGQETTSSTLTWVIAYLIRYPEIQEKVQKELDAVVGSNRMVGNADRPDLPYTNAVIMESQRCCNLVAQNITRCLPRDVEIDGRHFKKGTIFTPQISVVMRDPKVFPEPERFNPDRFIDENGKLRQVDELIPFSIGKRICLGEGLARMELFLFTANLFNQYKFLPGKVPPTLKRISGAGTVIQPYNCKVVLRR
ncbi:unnamed protein product [Bursaphelenchus xylophilus]|uniref:(pine wood nematode) hypothetical protein n=1 Tax=Bursaphelenchus xylophilus TaxID=6326 RepID=A0A1I7RLW8_BURXY|nr:unnamed protein product [Bursaphelenchus xylophilus]CAG9113296.1 unnamed protein product [Bursaphelenchus xylophilus]